MNRNEWLFDLKKNALINQKLLRKEGIQTHLTKLVEVTSTGIEVCVGWKLERIDP